MRIELTEFPRLKINQGIEGEPKAPSKTFLDTLKEAVSAANDRAREADSSAMALTRGESGNIHETMIAMQKADISIRLMVTATNKLIDAYNQLTQLR